MSHASLFFLLLILIPSLAGLIVGIIIHFVTKAEEKKLEEERRRKEKNLQDEQNLAMKKNDITEALESMNTTIFRLRETSERIKRQTAEIIELSQWLKNRNQNQNQNQNSPGDIKFIPFPDTANSAAKSVIWEQPCSEEAGTGEANTIGFPYRNFPPLDIPPPPELFPPP